jgi:catechol 2,3-dioxygenase-like lactoylglutathione lyase family enzyme
MIEQLSHVTVYVLNQDEALKFYRDVLSFEVRTDMSMDNGFRWLTVGPKTQPGLEIILLEPKESPMFNRQTAEQVKALVQAGAFGIGVFETADCRATCAELKAKGVQLLSEPTERFYGIEAVVKDNSGNWFSLCQRKK